MMQGNEIRETKLNWDEKESMELKLKEW